MEPRPWLYEKLTNSPDLNALVPAESIYGAGSLDRAPDDKPFLVINLSAELPGPFKGVRWQDCTIWAHGEPGSYEVLDEILALVERALSPPVSEQDYIATLFQGRSRDFVDDALGTVTQNVSLRLAIRHTVVG